MRRCDRSSSFSCTRSIDRARPVASSTSTIAPCSQTSRFAGSNGTGRWVRKRSMTSSFLTPMIESQGPHIPTSVRTRCRRRAPARRRSGRGCACRAPPTPSRRGTGPSRSSRSSPRSACRRGWRFAPSARSAAISSCATRNGSSRVFMKTRPSRFTTPSLPPVGRLHDGAAAAGRAGRVVRGAEQPRARPRRGTGTISRFDQM